MSAIISELTAVSWISVALIVSGVFFVFVGSLGVVRLPDFYTRTHAASKTDTLGILLILAGLMVYEGATLNSVKLGFILIFISLANPIGSHALARAAMKSGLKPLLFARGEWADDKAKEMNPDTNKKTN